LKYIKKQTFDQGTRLFTVSFIPTKETIQHIFKTVESTGNFKIINWVILEKD